MTDVSSSISSRYEHVAIYDLFKYLTKNDGSYCIISLLYINSALWVAIRGSTGFTSYRNIVRHTITLPSSIGETLLFLLEK